MSIVHFYAPDLSLATIFLCPPSLEVVDLPIGVSSIPNLTRSHADTQIEIPRTARNHWRASLSPPSGLLSFASSAKVLAKTRVPPDGETTPTVS